MCFYNGLSFLKRLPSQSEITEQSKAIDIEHGFKMKDSFMVELKTDKKKCVSNLQGMYDENAERQLDGLLPF